MTVEVNALDDASLRPLVHRRRKARSVEVPLPPIVLARSLASALQLANDFAVAAGLPAPHPVPVVWAKEDEAWVYHRWSGDGG